MSFLAALAPGDREALLAAGGRRRFDTGAILFHEGDRGAEVLVVLEGRVKLTCTTELGPEAVLAIREPGDLLGEMSAIDGQPRSATGTALEPVMALSLTGPAFLGYLARTPGASSVLLTMLARRLRDADSKRIGFLAQDTVGRVCARLVELGERFGADTPAGLRIDLRLTQEELAGWTGASREATVKALRTLRGLGWIATGRRGITLLDVEALRRRGI